MDNWDEIRTAYQVARMGTVSGAAEVLGVHHATVIRHIDALEKRLGERLFQRHARGYTPTEAGRDLLSVAQATEERFAQLSNRIRGQGETVAGDLVVTAVGTLGGRITEALTAFQAEHPDIVLRVVTGLRLFRLDFGEAHVAIRTGPQPSEPDYVVQRLGTMRSALYASRGYVASHGQPETEADLPRHRFVGPQDHESRAPFNIWLRDRVPHAAITFRTNDFAVVLEAIRVGAGIGFAAPNEAALLPGLVQIMPPDPAWDAPLWLVTHVDLHRTLKVQAVLAHLKAAAEGWD